MAKKGRKRQRRAKPKPKPSGARYSKQCLKLKRSIAAFRANMERKNKVNRTEYNKLLREAKRVCPKGTV